MRITLIFAFVVSSFIGCIGDDIIPDRIDENIRILTSLDSLGIEDSFLFEATYTNSVGLEESASIIWESSDTSLLSIDQTGLATGIAKGFVEIQASVELAEKTLSDTVGFFVSENTLISEPEVRTGNIQTTSSYVLAGSFELREEDSNLILEFGANYEASTALPGLYVYLGNNPNSIADAYEIAAVDVFSGAHEYQIPTSQVDLEEYAYVLYWCKPFGVKVGDGEIE